MAGNPRPVADGGAHHGTLFESFPDPLLAYANEMESDASDSNLVVRGVNPAFEDVFDLEADEVTGDPLDGVMLAGTIAPDCGVVEVTAGTDPSQPGVGDHGATDSSTTPTAGSLLDFVRDTGSVVRLRFGTDDETRHFRVRGIPTDTASDGAEGYLLFADVTERERERRNLATRVDQLEWLTSVARHDLRNPLEVAEIRLEAARDTGEDVHFDKVAGALDRIEQIVQDVLAIGAGSVAPTDPVALADVAEAAWETVDTADAEFVTSPGLPTVRGDADRLRGLFENLFRNAVEHGGPTVTVTLEPLSGGFAVVDDGQGVSQDVREHAFEAGYSTESSNSGLGLFIVREIAREHGWRVSLASGRDPSPGADASARFEFAGIERVESGDDVDESDDSDGADSLADTDGSN